MKKSYLITALALLGAGFVALALGLLAPYGQLQTVDVIGGAGYSAYQFLLFNSDSGIWSILAHLGGAVMISSAFALIFRKTVVNHCMLPTSLLALALSAGWSAACVSLLLAISTLPREYMRYPNAHPAVLRATGLCLIGCLVLLCVYFVKWVKKGSFKALFIDSLLTVVYFPAFFWLWYTLSNGLWDLLKDVI